MSGGVQGSRDSVSATPRSTPPQLARYTYQGSLGSGGFADVFLYLQQSIERPVAIKVLHANVVTPAVQEQFVTEADLMARLSEHTAIVSVYDVGVADDGRPYMVLEFCSGKTLHELIRGDRIDLKSALSIGVRVACAVESAHRLGILHRDIKPANVLTTQYGGPKLADFGIAVVAAARTQFGGLSFPWAAPELIRDETPGDVATDVYALAATIFHSIAGRAPHELPGSPNDDASIAMRALRSPVPRTGRPDVPHSLERVLSRGLATRPDERYASAEDLAKALNRVEVELGLAVTPLELSGAPAPAADEDTTRTRLRPLIWIDPEDAGPDTSRGGTYAGLTSGALTRSPRGAAVGAPADSRPRDASPVVGSAARCEEPDSIVADRLVQEPLGPSSGRARTGRNVSVAAAAAVLVLAGGVAYMALGDGPSATPTPGPGSSDDPAQGARGALIEAVPAVEGLSATSPTSGTGVRFQWSNPDPSRGDSYVWRTTSPTAAPGAAARVLTTDIDIAAPVGEQVCVEVMIRRDNSRTGDPRTECAAAMAAPQ